MARRLQWVDVFAKSAQEARVKTTSGGLLTILSAVVIVWLFLQELRSYHRITWEPQLKVDQQREARLSIFVDVEFPHLPCELLSLDAMDEMGNVQEHVERSLTKTDLGADGKALDPSIKQRQSRERQDAIDRRLANPEYKGSCFSALPDDQTCNTCEEVRKAYAAVNWRFHDGSGFEQCVEERYPEHTRENARNGCRISGMLSVAKVVGHLHFAPGESVFVAGRHSHDLSGYNMKELPYDFAHRIHHLSFGQGAQSELEDPLAGLEVEAADRSRVYRYFMKVVATRFEYLDGKELDTNQYSVTRHERGLTGGRDDDHPNTYHQVGGMPGIWMTYDISPMRIVNIERHAQTFGTLVINMCAILGAVVTSAAVLDRGVHEIDQALRARKNR